MPVVKKPSFATLALSVATASQSIVIQAHSGAHDHDPKVRPIPAEVKAAETNEVALRAMHEEYKADIEPIFRKKCFDCHSDRTDYPWYYKVPGIQQWIDRDIREARAHMEMSGGFPFTSKHSIDHDLAEIGKQIENHTMPPKSYVFVHAEAKLNSDEKKKVLAWISRSRKTLATLPTAPTVDRKNTQDVQ